MVKQIEWFGSNQFQNFLNELANEKTNRSRLKIMQQRAQNEQVARVRSASLRSSLKSYYASDDNGVTKATYEDRIEALNNLFGIK